MSLWGKLKCLTCLFNKEILKFSYLNHFHDICIMIMPLLTTGKNKIKGINRIGPHDISIYSIIFGSLLGDAHAERRKGGVGTRISFYQESTHVTYLLWLHNQLASKGYCHENLPVITTRLGKKGVVRKIVRFHTWTYTSWDWIYAEWYANGNKTVPESIGQYLTPLALTIWIMDSWVRNPRSLSLTIPYSFGECLLLISAMYKNFGLEPIILSTDTPSKYVIILKEEVLPKLEHIVAPFIFKGMKYKVVKNRGYSTKATSHISIASKSINPWFITGFSDAESSFMVFMNKNPKVKLGFQTQVCFQIGLHEKDKVLLGMIQSYFKGAGNISKQGKILVQYRVTSLKHLEIIAEHFENYPLITQKKIDFELWKQVFEILKNKGHLTEKGLENIAAIKASMNKGLSEELKTALPNINPVSKPTLVDQTIKNPNWLAGFVSGEGTFIVSIFKSDTPIGYTVRLIFRITQHSRDTELMKSLVNYFGCGRYVVAPLGYNHGDFVVSNLPDIVEKIIPFLKKYAIIGNKSLDFADFTEVASMMKVKAHTTKEGLKRIKTIKDGMNLGRK